MASRKGGKKYRLVLYTRMMSMWWTAVFALGIALLGLAWALYNWGYESWRWMVFAGVGGLGAFMGLMIFLLRKSAYVQPFSDHLRLATPFLRLNISYKRFRRSATASISALFPPNSVSGWQREIIAPLAKMTAIVIDLTSLPMSQNMLKLFLSPLFFKDKTPHLVILVDDWMRFSAEMDSMRHGTVTSAPQSRRDISILSKLPKK
ncbi:MAG: hypothetical protein JNK32_07990 [Anaerolineales bacterium]|nr:hypothetical protein [Anaerolineales bacterium]